MLARSLTTLKQNAKSLKIKLTNKQTPCITLEIELVSILSEMPQTTCNNLKLNRYQVKQSKVVTVSMIYRWKSYLGSTGATMQNHNSTTSMYVSYLVIVCKE